MSYYEEILVLLMEEDADIPRHLNIIKETWEQINVLGSEHFQISDLFFKIIIASSLPPSWDLFTKSYIGNKTNFIPTNPKREMSSQEFIGIIMSEYNHRESHQFGTLKNGVPNISSNFS